MILEKINNLVWGKGLIFLLLFTGAMITYKLKFIQFRLPALLAKNSKTENSGLSQFKTVCMSLGTAMGTGNIVGTASALALGGAGAVFWMWVTALIGSSTAFIDATLAQLHKQEDPLYGGYRGGPAYYIHNFFSKGKKFSVIGILFAFFGFPYYNHIINILNFNHFR